MENLPRLFEPIMLGKVQINNRIAFAPTGMSHYMEDGSMTDQALCHYIARAKGGAGLIIVQAARITEKYAAPTRRGLSCFDDKYLDGLKALADVIHYCEAKAIVQVIMGHGAQALFKMPGKDLVAPSPIPTKIPKGGMPRGLKLYEGVVGDTPRALSIEEIIELENAFVDSAERIKKAGFDGIEIHGAHGYLIAEFLSPLSNQRTGQYGGSFEKRLTLPLNLIKKTRQRVGQDFIIGYRISGDEHVEGGLTLEDTQKIVPILAQEGLDFIHMSSGRYESFKWTIPDEEGIMLPEARAIKEVVNIPVICPNIHDPRTGEKALKEGMTDMVSLSRGLLADPDWPNKARAANYDQIRKCIRCNSCLQHIFQDFSVRCAVNPEVGWERFLPKYSPPLPSGINL
jgi:2,4-dienoyl-CoA reductase-like NADH-dependent reductase (Old Yellow Enzyme family)